MWHLKEMEGQTVYGCDLAFQLFDSENCTGSYTCNAFESKEWIKEYWDNLSKEVEDYEFNYGELPVNCFENPEVFQVQIILNMASRLVSNSDFVEDNWSNEIELEDITIEKIIAEWSDCL